MPDSETIKPAKGVRKIIKNRDQSGKPKPSKLGLKKEVKGGSDDQLPPAPQQSKSPKPIEEPEKEVFAVKSVEQEPDFDFDEWPEEEPIKVIPAPQPSTKFERNRDDDEISFDEWPEESDDSLKPPTKPSSTKTDSDFDGWNQEDEKEFYQASGDGGKDNDEVEEKPAVANVLDKLDTKNQQWGGWNSWGVSLLANASKSVASITTNVAQKIESKINFEIPAPEELARQDRELEKILEKEAPSPPPPKDEALSEESGDGGSSSRKSSRSDNPFNLDQLMSGVTQISNKVITGGLDTLEGIGKKTIKVIQEKDRGLINKTKNFVMDKDRPLLSSILQEARTREVADTPEERKEVKKLPVLEILFDDYQGLVHLQALEMLSKQSSIKMQSLLAPLSGKALTDLQETFSEVAELCEMPEASSVEEAEGNHSKEALQEKLNEAVDDLNVEIRFAEVLKSWEKCLAVLDTECESGEDIHNQALHSLAEFAAVAVGKFHKMAEMILVLDYHSTANEADSLVRLTTIFFWHMHAIASHFNEKLNNLERSDEISQYITNIFLEASNANEYIQKAFDYFLPILQLGAA